MNSTEVIILAAGKGTRMNADVPKVLVELGGIPMIKRVLHSVQNAGYSTPVVVVGFEAQMVKDVCGESYTYVFQEEQKGTGHAVLVTEDALRDDTDCVVVVYGDQPFVTPKTLTGLAEPLHNGAHLVLATAVINDDELFEKQFARFGRIIRNEEGSIVKIVEAKDATEEELKVREVNVGFMAFNKQWAFRHLAELKNDNSQGEYYLTDLVKIAFEEGIKIHSVQMNEKEALGANTKEQLDLMHEYLEK
jgi:bifunctional UDP-N-acetylglucosamine pyrophosphorylase/glucosamine-1-phosphate N-acetyltransferase